MFQRREFLEFSLGGLKFTHTCWNWWYKLTGSVFFKVLVWGWLVEGLITTGKTEHKILFQSYYSRAKNKHIHYSLSIGSLFDKIDWSLHKLLFESNQLRTVYNNCAHLTSISAKQRELTYMTCSSVIDAFPDWIHQWRTQNQKKGQKSGVYNHLINQNTALLRGSGASSCI